MRGRDVDAHQIIRLSSEHRRLLESLRVKASKNAPTGTTPLANYLASKAAQTPEPAEGSRRTRPRNNSHRQRWSRYWTPCRDQHLFARWFRDPKTWVFWTTSRPCSVSHSRTMTSGDSASAPAEPYHRPACLRRFGCVGRQSRSHPVSADSLCIRNIRGCGRRLSPIGALRLPIWESGDETEHAKSPRVRIKNWQLLAAKVSKLEFHGEILTTFQ